MPPDLNFNFQPTKENPATCTAPEANPVDPSPASAQLVDSVPSSTYALALEFLYGRLNYERSGHAPYTSQHYRLDRMRKLLDLLDNPQNRYAIVHVAGTKGKGSVSHILADCIQACGYRTGLYTSPHLVLLEERIRFQGQIVSPQQLASLTQRLRIAAEQLEQAGGGRATFFELTTAMGLLHFAHQAADCVVLEVGLGGRLDSTNVCSPLISVITSISLDHQKQLGDTLSEIAQEKAGIIKLRTPVVATSHEPTVRQILSQRAAECQAPLHLIDRDFHVRWHRLEPEQAGLLAASNIPAVAEVTYHPQNEQNSLIESSSWPTRMLGRHQADNIGGALATLDLMAGLGWNLPAEKLRSAIANSQPRARLQIVSTLPTLIIDTAHNPASMLAGLQALDEHFRGVPIVGLFASSRDKDFRQMLELLLPRCRCLVLTAYQNNPRAVPCSDLTAAASDIIRQQHLACQIQTAETPQVGLDLANTAVHPRELLYATGSFFLAAELLELLALSE